MALHYIRLPAYSTELPEVTNRRALLADALGSHDCMVQTLRDGTVVISIQSQKEKVLNAMAQLFEHYGFPVTLKPSSNPTPAHSVRRQNRDIYVESALCGSHSDPREGYFHPSLTSTVEVY